MTGPTSEPTSCPVLSQPSEYPRRSSGTWLATSAIAAAENPAKIPISPRNANICHTLAATPISPVKMPIAMLERISISLRPCLSDSLPQIGEVKAATNDVLPPRMPAQIATPLWLSTPSSGRNSGMIGVSTEFAIAVTNWIATIAHSVWRQLLADSVLDGPVLPGPVLSGPVLSDPEDGPLPASPACPAGAASAI